jgi:DNA-binding protein H-NS
LSNSRSSFIVSTETFAKGLHMSSAPSSLIEVRKKIEALRARELAIQDQQRGSIISQILGMMDLGGITIQQIYQEIEQAGHRAEHLLGKPGEKVRVILDPSEPVVKYRDPKTGQTWTGRGRLPLWLKAAEKKGKKRDAFLVSGSTD